MDIAAARHTVAVTLAHWAHATGSDLSQLRIPPVAPALLPAARAALALAAAGRTPGSMTQQTTAGSEGFVQSKLLVLAADAEGPRMVAVLVGLGLTQDGEKANRALEASVAAASGTGSKRKRPDADTTPQPGKAARRDGGSNRRPGISYAIELLLVSHYKSSNREYSIILTLLPVLLLPPWSTPAILKVSSLYSVTTHVTALSHS